MVILLGAIPAFWDVKKFIVIMRLKHFLCAVDEWLFYVDYMINMEIRSLSWPCKAPEFVYVSLAALSAAPFFHEHWEFNH